MDVDRGGTRREQRQTAGRKRSFIMQLLLFLHVDTVRMNMFFRIHRDGRSEEILIQ